MSHPIRICLAVLLLIPPAMSQIAAAAAGDWNELPDGAIEIAIDDADLAVSLSPTVVGARIRTVPDAAGAAPAPLVEDSDGTVLILAPTDPPMSRLRLGLEVPAGRAIRIRGARLRASLVAVGSDAPVDSKADRPRSSPLDIDVVDSSVTIEGPVALGIVAADSSVTATAVDGPVELGLTATFATVAGGDGPLTVDAGSGSSLQIDDRTGTLRLQGTDAAFVLNRCTGGLAADLTAGRLEINGHSGLLTLTGDRTAVRAARSEFPRGSLELRDTTVALEQLRANLTAGLVASTIEVDDLWGALQLTVDGSSSVEGSEIEGSVEANLQPGATGRFSFRKGVLQAKLDDAELEVGGAQYLTIDAVRSTVVAAGFTGIKELRSMDSDIELDGTTADRIHNVFVQGRSTLRLTVGAPCRVKVLGVNATDSTGFSSFGCEAGYGERPRWTGPWTDSFGNHPTSVILEIGRDTDVTVEGRS